MNARPSTLLPALSPKAVGDLSAATRKVAILLATFHGQHYLCDQLDSFAAQTHSNWEVWASDDGSKDDTQRILVRYRRLWGAQRLSIHNGPRDGFTANFLSLACKAEISADYFAYSDQDDIWEPDKLSRALAWLDTVPNNVPALYCSRTRLVDENNKEIGVSAFMHVTPSFENALVQCIAGGNTMVFNRAARDLAMQAGSDVRVPSHDWWMYLLVTGAGGAVYWDEQPTVRYRQHEDAMVGENLSLKAKIGRFKFLISGGFHNWLSLNLYALRMNSHLLHPQSIIKLNNILGASNINPFVRIRSIVYVRAFRSNVFQQMLIMIAIFFVAVKNDLSGVDSRW